MFIKVCGITRAEDAQHAAAHGATALGFVFWARSPRIVTAAQAADIIAALPAAVTPVGVFVNEPIDGIRSIVEQTGIRVVQLHGDESPDYADALDCPVLRAVRVNDGDVVSGSWPAETTFLVDTVDPVRRGGTGVAVDWKRAAALARERRIVLAGGLTPANVAEAITAVRPFGVDVSSGVEASPGVKDFDKVARFLANARSAFTGACKDVS
jgi:phosphoribosylanthranilate isomerase